MYVYKALKTKKEFEECIEKLINILTKCQMIKVLKQKDHTYVLEFLNNIELSHALHCIEYAEFKELLDEIVDYKTTLDYKSVNSEL